MLKQGDKIGSAELDKLDKIIKLAVQVVLAAPATATKGAVKSQVPRALIQQLEVALVAGGFDVSKERGQQREARLTANRARRRELHSNKKAKHTTS